MDFGEYEREGRAEYAALASAVASILTAAINAEGGYRLQQITKRAKHPTSLRKKLDDRNIISTTTLESDIKDLAGCRIILYTNTDVLRFIKSDTIRDNFEVVETKIHHPQRIPEDASELYVSNHWVITLRPERIALPEYTRFCGMRCEIQVQTILNHAWAEMAHDTIYKAPTLGGFGGNAFEGIKNRMEKIARTYLLPAGYEFQKIASDFQRLVDGKDLFEHHAPLESIVDAVDNNVRSEYIEKFADYVLQFLDNIQEVYSEIVERLVAAVKSARDMPPISIETPYGAFPGKTYRDVLKSVAEILSRYRYVDVESSFYGLIALYSIDSDEDERKPLMDLGAALARHNLDVWRQHGPTVQLILVECIRRLGEEQRRGLWRLTSSMLGEILGAEVRGASSSSNALTLQRGAVVASEFLRSVRKKAIDLLKQQFALAESDEERHQVLLSLHSSTRKPISVAYDNALAELIMEDTRTVIEFQTQIATTLSFELLQFAEEMVNSSYWTYRDLPAGMANDSALAEASAAVIRASLEFRDVANSDPEFVIYKTLVGFNSVFPMAWEERDPEIQAYRSQQVDALVASVGEDNADIWFSRVRRCARTESDDAATFPVFVSFLERLAVAQPAIVLGYIEQIDKPLTNFLPSMLAGLMRSTERERARARIDEWVSNGKHLVEIARYLRSADPFDEGLLQDTFDCALKYDNRLALRTVILAAAGQFAAHPGTLIQKVFLPALHHLSLLGDFSWVRTPGFTWFRQRVIHALDEEQASRVLDALIPYPRLESDAEYITAAIAERWPVLVASFVGQRQEFARSGAAPSYYDAVPYAVHQLQQPLAAVPEVLLDAARAWFDADPQHFVYEGGRLLAAIFPDLSNGFEATLAKLIEGGKEEDFAFVLSVLTAFEGKNCIYGLVHKIAATVQTDSPLLDKARRALDERGGVAGEFGYAELYAERKKLLEPWLDDDNENVKKFAAERLRELEQSIAEETRAAEASIALRKLEYEEELGDNGGR